MTFLITSDIHLTDKPSHEYRWKFLEWLDALAQEKGSEAIFILGDLSQEKDHHSSILVNRIHETFYHLASKRSVYILKGNHDHPDGGVPYWKFLSSVPHLHYVDRILEQTIESDRILLLAHSKHPRIDWEGLDFVSYRFVFMHQTLPGTLSSTGHVLGGDDLPPLPAGPIYVSGDIHTPQTIYVGAPYDTRFGDHIEGRILEWNGQKLVSIPAPRYQLRVVDLDLDEEGTWADSIRQFDASGTVFRFRILVPSNRIHERREVGERLTSFCTSLGLNVDSILFVKKESETEEIVSQRPDILSFKPAPVLQQYVTHNGIDDPAYLKKGLEFIERFGG